MHRLLVSGGGSISGNGKVLAVTLEFMTLMCEGNEVHNEWPVSEMVKLSEMECRECGGECLRVIVSAHIRILTPTTLSM